MEILWNSLVLLKIIHFPWYWAKAESSSFLFQPPTWESVQDPNRKAPCSCHHMLVRWTFIPPGTFNPSSQWGYDATIQSLWPGKGFHGDEQWCHKEGIVTVLNATWHARHPPSYIREGGRWVGETPRGPVSENGKSNHLWGGKKWTKGEKYPVSSRY